MRKCRLCSRTERTHRIIDNKDLGYVCERCYQRETLNPVRYDLPKYGEVKYSPDGKPICHMCGKAFDKLLSHVWQVHDMNEHKYKEVFGLAKLQGIMSDKSTNLASKRAYENYDTVIKENLLKKGKDSRFKKGHKGRPKEKVREQTRRKLVDHMNEIGGHDVE